MKRQLLIVSICALAAPHGVAQQDNIPYFAPHIVVKWFGKIPTGAHVLLFKNAHKQSWRSFFNGISKGVLPSKEVLVEPIVEDYLQSKFLPPCTESEHINHAATKKKLIHYFSRFLVLSTSLLLKVARGKPFEKSLQKIVVTQIKNKIVNVLYSRMVMCAHRVARRQGYSCCDLYPEIIKQEQSLFALSQFSWHMLCNLGLHLALNYCIESCTALSKECNNQL